MFRYLRRQGFHQKLFDVSNAAIFNAIKSYKSFLEMFISETRLLKGFKNVTKNRENAVIAYILQQNGLKLGCFSRLFHDAILNGLFCEALYDVL